MLSPRARTSLTYAWRHCRWPDLDYGERFTEMVQRRKLVDRDARHPALMDKLAAKALAAQILGESWVIPTLWCGEALPHFRPFATPAILKANHGCNQYRILRKAPTASDWASLRELTRGWLERPYGGWLDEWAYRDTPRGLLAEPLVGEGNALPIDYKIYVFGGRATHVQVHLEREHAHRWILHDRDWKQLVHVEETPPRPRSLAAMLEAAETMATGHDFLRVDFYEVGRRPLFGEFCLYPGSGLDPFAADWIDLELGRLWREAVVARELAEVNAARRSGLTLETSAPICPQSKRKAA